MDLVCTTCCLGDDELFTSLAFSSDIQGTFRICPSDRIRFSAFFHMLLSVEYDIVDSPAFSTETLKCVAAAAFDCEDC